MTHEWRKKLEDAMVAAQLENHFNLDPKDSMADELQNHYRNGCRGYSEMGDGELLDTAKKEVGYDDFDRQLDAFIRDPESDPEEVDAATGHGDDGTTKMRELVAVIDAIIDRKEFKVGDKIRMRANDEITEEVEVEVEEINYEGNLRVVNVRVPDLQFAQYLKERKDGAWDYSAVKSTPWRIR